MPRPKDFSISKNEDGFTVTTTNTTSEDRFPQTIRIDVAYDVAIGNPWKKYSPLDFKLGKNSGIDVSMTKEKAKLLSARENSLKLEVISIPFRLTVKGFDVNRDLKIKLVKEG